MRWQLVPVAEAQGSAKLLNPLSEVPSVEALLFGVVNVILIFAVPVIVFFVIYAGFMYVTAQGNPEKLQTASRALLYALIGAVIIMGAFAIATIVGNVVDQF